jgi:hypothetical protein
LVHYLPTREIKAPDRKLLNVMRHPLAKGTAAPIFRTIRRGYHPWFITPERGESWQSKPF